MTTVNNAMSASVCASPKELINLSIYKLKTWNIRIVSLSDFLGILTNTPRFNLKSQTQFFDCPVCSSIVDTFVAVGCPCLTLHSVTTHVRSQYPGKAGHNE